MREREYPSAALEAHDLHVHHRVPRDFFLLLEEDYDDVLKSFITAHNLRERVKGFEDFPYEVYRALESFVISGRAGYYGVYARLVRAGMGLYATAPTGRGHNVRFDLMKVNRALWSVVEKHTGKMIDPFFPPVVLYFAEGGVESFPVWDEGWGGAVLASRDIPPSWEFGFCSCLGPDALVHALQHEGWPVVLDGIAIKWESYKDFVRFVEQFSY